MIKTNSMGLAFALGLQDPVRVVSDTSKELREKRGSLVRELEPLSAKKPSEFTEEERKMWQDKYSELGKVEADLIVALEQEDVKRTLAAKEGRNLSDQDKKDFASFSFRKLFLGLSAESGTKLDGIELEMHQEAVREAKDQGRKLEGIGVPLILLNSKPFGFQRATTGQGILGGGADGAYLKQEMPLMFFEALKNALVLPGIGAKFISNLVGDLPLVQGGQFTASFSAEDATDTTAKIAFGKVTLAAKRVSATGAFTRKLMNQASIDIESLLESELIFSIANALQTSIINGGGTNDILGILGVSGIGDVPGGTNGLAPTWGNLVMLETLVANANAADQSMAYLSNAKVRGKMKTIEKATNTGLFLWDKGEVNNYPAYVTNGVPSGLTKGTSNGVCSAMIFGEWSKLYIGQWGGLDIVVDPYSLKKKGEIEITVISHYDAAPVWPAAFAATKDVLTT
jgi:HK97 family phage major capsid protein